MSQSKTPDRAAHAAHTLLQDLRARSLILNEDWEALTAPVREQLEKCPSTDALLHLLVEHRLLTKYQGGRIKAGKTFGLVLGNYRLLESLGAGGMGTVYLGEHLRLRRRVAIKVLPLVHGQDFELLLRFMAEIRGVAQLQHPNIIAAIDAGEVASPDPQGPVLHYFVMEYVEGEDLHAYIRANGPLPPAPACALIHQVASALAEAHRHNLVHRDIKPSNIRVTPQGQAKLLDFGLARHFGTRLTEPGCALGTIDYMAPEQAQDSSSVDIRADIYSLGGTLFSCLTGRLPFASQGNFAKSLAAHLTQPPPSPRLWQPDVPAELDAVVTKMMARQPDDRFPTPQAVMRALTPFLPLDSRMPVKAAAPAVPLAPVTAESKTTVGRKQQLLVVDDDVVSRTLCRRTLEAVGLQADEAGNGTQALELLRTKPYDLVVLDVDMPQMPGTEVLRQLRDQPPSPHLKVVMYSGHVTPEEMARMLAAGADDYLPKPFNREQFLARIQAALRLKDAQDRSDLLNRHLLAVNTELERDLSTRDAGLLHARDALLLALAQLAGHRQSESGAHLLRLQRYCRCLAEELAGQANWAGQIDGAFIHMLECCAPLHDIGVAGLPDYILMKPGKLDTEERLIMQSHTLIGAGALQRVARRHGAAGAFLQMAIDIVRHHHERYDGTGYPDRLAGTGIPLAARIVTVGDVYDALRCRRAYRPALAPAVAIQIILRGMPGHFDPLLQQTFEKCAPQFERIFQEIPDGSEG